MICLCLGLETCCWGTLHATRLLTFKSIKLEYTVAKPTYGAAASYILRLILDLSLTVVEWIVGSQTIT
jgi:hypothetical protein